MTSTLKAPRKVSEPKPPREARPFLPQSKKAKANASVSAPSAPKPLRPVAGVDNLIIGGEPRVHLLPPQVVASKKAKVRRRRLGLGVIGAVVLVAAGFALANVSLAASQNSLLAAQQQTASLLQQQAKYGDVLKVKADAAAIQTSQVTATAQEIAWQPFIVSLESTMPAGSRVMSVAAAIDVPFGVDPPAADPTQGPRVATITATMLMQQSDISAWLNSLTSLKGFVDATPNSVTLGEGGYVVTVTIHVNDGALENRFTKDAGESK